jgi:hypothetical protein
MITEYHAKYYAYALPASQRKLMTLKGTVVAVKGHRVLG